MALKIDLLSKEELEYELNLRNVNFRSDSVASDVRKILRKVIKDVNIVANPIHLKDKLNVNNEFAVISEKFKTLMKSVNDLKDNKLEAYLKSEPIPEDNSGPVKVAVAKNFDEIVTNNNQDTLIEFYAPWCGHCKKLAPIYDELGEKLKDEDVAIVKIDASNNDVPSEYEVRGFPTLYWKPKDPSSKPVPYEGGREVDDFIKYIAKAATNELKGYDRKGKAKAVKTEL